MQRMIAHGAIIAVAASVALSGLASLFASPLSTPTAAAPTWAIEMTSATTSPVTVLVYGREAGLHILRVPAANGDDEARVVPARLAQGELHMMSLGLSSLRVRANSPRGVMPMSWGAEARTVTAVQNKDGIGVRTGW